MPNQLNWPAKSSDLSLIKQVWGYIKKRLESKYFDNIDQLFNAIKNEWDQILNEIIHYINSSFIARCQVCLLTLQIGRTEQLFDNTYTLLFLKFVRLPKLHSSQLSTSPKSLTFFNALIMSVKYYSTFSIEIFPLFSSTEIFKWNEESNCEVYDSCMEHQLLG